MVPAWELFWSQTHINPRTRRAWQPLCESVMLCIGRTQRENQAVSLESCLPLASNIVFCRVPGLCCRQMNTKIKQIWSTAFDEKADSTWILCIRWCKSYQEHRVPFTQQANKKKCIHFSSQVCPLGDKYCQERNGQEDQDDFISH